MGDGYTGVFDNMSLSVSLKINKWKLLLETTGQYLRPVGTFSRVWSASYPLGPCLTRRTEWISTWDPVCLGSTKWKLRKWGMLWGRAYRAAPRSGDWLEATIVSYSQVLPQLQAQRGAITELSSDPCSPCCLPFFFTYCSLSPLSDWSHCCPRLLNISHAFLLEIDCKVPLGFKISRIYAKHVQIRAPQAFCSPQILVQQVTIQSATKWSRCK